MAQGDDAITPPRGTTTTADATPARRYVNRNMTGTLYGGTGMTHYKILLLEVLYLTLTQTLSGG